MCHIGLVRMRIRHRSHHFATQSSHCVDSAGWQAKMASIEFWIPYGIMRTRTHPEQAYVENVRRVDHWLCNISCYVLSRRLYTLLFLPFKREQVHLNFWLQFCLYYYTYLCKEIEKKKKEPKCLKRRNVWPEVEGVKTLTFCTLILQCHIWPLQRRWCSEYSLEHH